MKSEDFYGVENLYNDLNPVEPQRTGSDPYKTSEDNSGTFNGTLPIVTDRTRIEVPEVSDLSANEEDEKDYFSTDYLNGGFQ